MLSSFRKSLRTWAMGAILLLALVAMVVTGFGTGGGGIGDLAGGASGGTLATAGGREVTAEEVRDAVTREYDRARQQQPTLDLASFLAGGTYDAILDQLITAAAIERFGGDQGLIVSQRMIDREIVNIPSFRNFTGQFDETVFRQVLRSQNLTEAGLRADIARSLMQRQLLAPIAASARVPDAVAREYASLLLERRRGTIGVVPAELLAAEIAVTDAEVAAYYRENPERFTIPERRVVRYALIGQEQIGEAGRPTDAEIAAAYRQNSAQYGPRETRTLQQVVLPDQAAAQAFVQRVRGGASFAEAASQAGFGASDITFPDQGREQFAGVASPEVANAAFSAQQGAMAGPIRSELGFHVVRVERINAVPARPLEAVRGEIATALEQRKRADALGALLERVEDRLADGASFEEVVRAERLAVVTTPPITAAGQPVGQAWQAPPELQPLLRSAFEIDAESPEPMVEQVVANERFALLDVARVEPAAPPPLAQIQREVRGALVRSRALQRARAMAQGMVARINGGTPAERVFAEARPRLPPAETVNLRRLDISRAGQQVPPPLITLFSLAQGRAQIVAAPNEAGWFIVHHAQRTPGDARTEPRLIETTKAEFTASAGEEIAQQFARAVELESEVERDEEAIARARREIGGRAPGQ